MRNITLYISDYSPYGGIQPYFTSERARDRYLSGLYKYTLQAENVNINLKENLEFDLKIEIDINTAQMYNFVVVDYLGTKYYADIYDYSQISVGRTKIYCRRNPLYEVVDYLSYFKDIYVDKATFNNYLKYSGLNSAINLGKYVTKNDIRIVSLKANSHNVRKILTYVIYIDSDKVPANEYVSCLYGEVTNYGIIFLPMESGDYTSVSTDGKNHLYSVNNSTKAVNNFINKNSPYIFRIELLYLPYEIVNTSYKLMFYMQGIIDTDDCIYFSMQTTGEDYGFTVTKFYSDISFDKYSTDAEIRFFQRENSFNVNLDRFKRNNTSGANIQYLKLEGYFIPNIQGSSFLFYLSGDSNTLENNSNNSIMIITSVNSTFVVSSAENFKAQNLYYDAMTENSRNQRIIHGALQTGENVAIGASQIGMGAAMIATGNLGGAGTLGMGFSNILRGAFEIGHTINDTVAFDRERELLAKNEMAKPDSMSVGNNAPIKFLEQNGDILFIERVLTPLSKNIANGKLNATGIECNIYTEKIGNIFDDLIVNGMFFIRASNFSVQSPVANSTLVELISLLKKGMRYTHYE